MDLDLLRALNDFAAAHDGIEDPVTAYVGLSAFLFAGLLATLFVVVRGNGRRQGPRAAVAAGASAALALGVAQIVSHLIERPRPYAGHVIHLFVARSADASFPSDHATAAFAIAVAIWLRSRRLGWAALVLAAALAVGRVVVGAHYPSDVAAGAALGSIAALALWAPPLRRRLDRIADAWTHVWGGTLRTGRRALGRG